MNSIDITPINPRYLQMPKIHIYKIYKPYTSIHHIQGRDSTAAKALIFQEMARSFRGNRRPTSSVACYKIRRVYLTIVCHRPRDLYCMSPGW